MRSSHRVVSLLGGLAVIALHGPLANASGPPQRYALPKLEVKVVNTPNVIVKNTSASPVPVQIVPTASAAEEYFTITGDIAFINGGGIGTLATVPVGRRYLIEQASVFCSTRPGVVLAGVGIAVRTTPAELHVVHQLPSPPLALSADGTGYLSSGAMILMEAPAGAEIGGRISPAQVNVSSACQFTISGHSVAAT